MGNDTNSPAISVGSASNAVVRLFFVTGLIVSVTSAGVFYLFATPATATAYRLLVWGCLVVAAVFAIGGWRVRNAPVSYAVLVATWSALGLVCMITIGLGEGIHALSLGFVSVLICVVTVVTSQKAGALMAAFSAAWVLALTFAEVSHWIPGAAAVPTSPLLMRAATLLLMVSSAYSVGMMVARVLLTQLIRVRDQEARYRALFTESPTGLLLHRDGEVLDLNRVASAIVGARQATRHPMSAELSVEENTARQSVLGHARALASAPVGTHVATAEVVIPTPGNGKRTLQVSAVRVAEQEGPATLSMFFDDSERAAAERLSRQSQLLLSNLFAASPDCIMLGASPTNQLLMVNDAFLQVTGYATEEVIGKSPLTIGLWRDPEEHQQFREALETYGSVKDRVVVFVTKHGVHRYMQLSANGFNLDGVNYAVLVARDISENEQARRELQAILSSAALGIALTQYGHVTRVNEACEAMFKYLPGGMNGLDLRSLGESPEDVERLSMSFNETFLRDYQVDTEIRLRQADGTIFWCRLRGKSLDPSQPLTGGTVWIVEDVTERRRMQQALAAARDAAEAANVAKSAFLANTSHEIRTPLNGLIGLGRIAVRPKTDDATRLRHLHQMLESAEGLADIMGSVLDMSKIEAGKLTLDNLHFDLHEVLTTMHRHVASLVAGRELQCTLHIADDVPRIVFGDPVRTRQIVNNFVSNALKFTERGAIALSAAAGASGGIRITVRDTGVGVDAATLERLFQPFTQADVSTTRRFGGTGLGLSICRELATLMGGSVGADSELGAGSAFWAELPLPMVGPFGELGVTRNRSIDVEHPFAALADESQRASSITSPRRDGARSADTQSVDIDDARSAPGALIGARVLLAEDNPVNAIIATTLLQDWGVLVTEVNNGRAAVEAVDAAVSAGQPFALVLMDVQMPVLDGFAASRELRCRYDAACLPIVALTAGVLDAEREEALACGMNAFLAKPFAERVLREILIDLLEQSQHLARLSA